LAQPCGPAPRAQPSGGTRGRPGYPGVTRWQSRASTEYRPTRACSHRTLSASRRHRPENRTPQRLTLEPARSQERRERRGSSVAALQPHSARRALPAASERVVEPRAPQRPRLHPGPGAGWYPRESASMRRASGGYGREPDCSRTPSTFTPASASGHPWSLRRKPLQIQWFSG